MLFSTNADQAEVTVRFAEMMVEFLMGQPRYTATGHIRCYE
jgi:hypothetical protein